MKLTKTQAKAHQQALDLVHSDKPLTWEERLFILENYHEGATQMNGVTGAFFTPFGLARDFAIDAGGGRRVIDLCAGIGMLSFALGDRAKELVCVEICAEYVEVGRRVLPDAQWIHADIFEVDYAQLGNFDLAMANPPFGHVKTANGFNGRYRGKQMEYKTIELASTIAPRGAFIIPQPSAPFQLAGNSYSERTSDQYQKFHQQTGIELSCGCGIDTNFYCEDWKNTRPCCEVVVCDFESCVLPVIPESCVQSVTPDLFSLAA